MLACSPIFPTPVRQTCPVCKRKFCLHRLVIVQSSQIWTKQDYTKMVYLEHLHIYISKIGVYLHVPESMSGVQKVNFPDWSRLDSDTDYWSTTKKGICHVDENSIAIKHNMTRNVSNKVFNNLKLLIKYSSKYQDFDIS